MSVSAFLRTATFAVAVAAIATGGAGGAADPSCTWSPLSFTSVVEGDSGTAVASLELRCTNPTTETFTVQFSLGQGTAVSSVDYVDASGVSAVPPGDSATPIDVEVLGDTRPEATEQLGIQLAEASGRVALPWSALVNIVDDDGFGVSTTPPSVPEGDAGPTLVDVEVRFSHPLEYPFEVSLYTVDGTATAGSDYEFTNVTQEFQPGETSKTYRVTILGDTEVEPDETAFIGLATGGVQSLTSGYLTIVNDDEEPPPPSGPCITLSETAVDVPGIAATPAQSRVTRQDGLTVTNCGTTDVSLEARATDATGSSGTWQLTDYPRGNPVENLCELGPNLFASAFGLTARGNGAEGAAYLTTQDQVLVDPADEVTSFVFPAAAVADAWFQIAMPCAGSVGLGEPMSTNINLTAIAP